MQARKFISPIKLHLSLLLSAALMLMACQEKEDNTPSHADKDRMEQLLDHSLTQAVDFCNQYGTYLLYDFDQSLDFAYQFEQATNWNEASIERLNREEAVDAVSYLCNKFFSRYNDHFKQTFLPRKVLMVKSLKAKALGFSQPDAYGFHAAAANIGSMTFAYDKAKISSMTEAEELAYLRQWHATLLAGYLIKVRADYPVGEEYINVSQSYYASLMDAKRTQARRLSDEFFLSRGFFRPDDDESTYFISAEEDMTVFAKQLIQMDEKMQDSLCDYPLMENKLARMAKGLQQMGVDIVAINPLAQYYLDMSEASVLPSIIVRQIVTPTNEADLTFTLLRGSRSMSRAEVWVNGTLQQTLDLSEEADAARITKTVSLTGLFNDANPIEIRLYEQSRPRPSAVATTTAYHVSKVSYLNITNSREERYSLHLYNGYDYTEGSNNPNISTIRFYKRATEVDHATGVEKGKDHRFWIVYRENGLVTRIVVKQEYVDYENLKNGYNVLYTYEFHYNDNAELTGVTRDGEPLVDHVVYAAGLMVGYDYEGKTYHPTYDTSVTPAVRLDCLDEKLSGHAFTFRGTEALNYFYQPDIPAVIPGSEAGIPLQLLYSKYLFTELKDVWSNRWVLEENTHYTEVTLDDVTWMYNFILE